MDRFHGTKTKSELREVFQIYQNIMNKFAFDPQGFFFFHILLVFYNNFWIPWSRFNQDDFLDQIEKSSCNNNCTSVLEKLLTWLKVSSHLFYCWWLLRIAAVAKEVFFFHMNFTFIWISNLVRPIITAKKVLNYCNYTLQLVTHNIDL